MPYSIDAFNLNYSNNYYIHNHRTISLQDIRHDFVRLSGAHSVNNMMIVKRSLLKQLNTAREIASLHNIRREVQHTASVAVCYGICGAINYFD